jgi:molecular chaperone DnaJ
MTLPVTFAEATLGADIPVPTLSGEEVVVRLAPGTANGKILRVKNRGVKKDTHTGDLLITVEVQIPQRVEGKAKEALETFAELTKSESPRTHFKERAGA